MILAAGKNKGKRLARMILEELQQNGSVEVAAVSTRGVERIVNVGQRVSNKLKKQINVNTEQREIELFPGEYREALIVQLTI